MEIKNIVRTNIRKYRKLKKMTQKQLAEKCQTSPSYIGSLESKNRNIKITSVQKIATALEVEPYILLKPDELAEEKAPII